MARRLAVCLSAPSFDLDDVAYASGVRIKRPLEERLIEAREIAIRPSCIAEGIYLWRIDDLLDAADIIVWLDAPWRVAARRIVRRHVLATLKGANRHPGMLRVLAFLLWARSYYVSPSSRTQAALDDDGAVTRFHSAHVLVAHTDKVVRCSSSSEVDAFVANIADLS